MSIRDDWAAPALLVVLSPILALPALFGPGHPWIAPAAAMGGLVWAILLATRFGNLGWFVGALALSALAGFAISPDQRNAVNHFCGLTLGLLAMSTVVTWCRTRDRLAWGVLALFLCGAAAVAVGSRSTTSVHTSKGLFGKAPPAAGPSRPLPLSEIHGHKSVNRNALAATAMMLLPIALAVGWRPAPGFRGSGALRFVALAAAALAAAVVLMMQSRSAWLSAGLIAWLFLRRWMRPAPWLGLGGLLFLAGPAAALYLWRHDPRGLEVIATLQLRVGIWQQGLLALQSSPWFGIGLDNFRQTGYSLIPVWPDQIAGRPHAHNFFLQTALDVGVIGLATYLAVVVFVMRRGLELVTLRGVDPFLRAVGIGAALSLVSVHVYGILDAVALGTKVGLFQWVVSGLVLAAWRIHAGTGSKQAMT